MSEVIYIPLQEEGTDCWRPVHAEQVLNDVYEITVDDEPRHEHWRFPLTPECVVAVMCFPMEKSGS